MTFNYDQLKKKMRSDMMETLGAIYHRVRGMNQEEWNTEIAPLLRESIETASQSLDSLAQEMRKAVEETLDDETKQWIESGTFNGIQEETRMALMMRKTKGAILSLFPPEAV